jgi:hypothetical protein
MPVITEAQLIAAIRKVAADNPDVTYDRGPDDALCEYRPNARNPLGCAVGAALTSLGVPDEALQELDGAGDESTAWRTGGPRLALGKFVQDKALASGWVSAFQMWQDQGKSWRAAALRADVVAEDNGWRRS